MPLAADRSPLRFLAVTFVATLVPPAVALPLLLGSTSTPRVDGGVREAVPSVRVTDASSIISGPITIARDG